MTIEIKVPTLGESVTEATVGKWFKKAGDAVKVDEPLVELETDKVTVEVPAPVSGVLAAISADTGAIVNIGAVLGALREGAAGAVHSGACCCRAAPAAAAAPAKKRHLPPHPHRRCRPRLPRARSWTKKGSRPTTCPAQANAARS